MSRVPNELRAPDAPTGVVPRPEKLLAASTSEKIENAPDALKQQIDSWDPAGLAARSRTDFDLMRSIKRQFDPHNTLNPGRFVAGI